MQLSHLGRTLWNRLRRWKSGVRHQVTWSGLAFTALIVLIGLSAFASGNNLLFLLLAAMLSTMLVSGFISRLSLSGLVVKLLLPDHVFARRRLPARLQLYNSKFLMPAFSVHLSSSEAGEEPLDLYFPIVPGRTTVEALSTVCFAKRGLHGDSDYQFTTRFPFGFTERRLEVRLHREVLVYPSIDAQPGWEDLLFSLEGDMEAYLRGRGTDFYRIRPYEPTESARHVDWKATAHTGELQVREFAREEDHLIEIAFDLQAQGHSAWFEEAVECAAYLSWRFAGRGARLRFFSQNFEARLPESAGIYDILRYLAQVTPQRTTTSLYPNEESSFQIAFSAFPQKLLDSGWHRAHIVSPGAGAAGGGRRIRPHGSYAGSPRDGEDVRHGRR